MKVDQYKFIQLQREDQSRYFQLHKLTCFGLIWSPSSTHETYAETKSKAKELNELGLCVIDWEFIDRFKDCNDWEGT